MPCVKPYAYASGSVEGTRPIETLTDFMVTTGSAAGVGGLRRIDGNDLLRHDHGGLHRVADVLDVERDHPVGVEALARVVDREAAVADGEAALALAGDSLPEVLLVVVDHVTVAPHALLDEVVALLVEGLLHVVEQVGLGQGAVSPAPVAPIAGLALDEAGSVSGGRVDVEGDFHDDLLFCPILEAASLLPSWA